MLTTERDTHTDDHVFSDVEVTDRETRLANGWLLTRNRCDGLRNELLDVFAGVLLLTQANVDDHFRDTRESVDIRDRQLTLESICNVCLEPLLKGDMLTHGE